MAHDMATEDPLLTAIVEKIVQRMSPSAVYIFGSRARGDTTTGSDYDLLVVVERSDLPGHQRDREALRALRAIRAPVDVMVLTRDEFERGSRVVTSLPATVLREGRRLHAA